MHLSECPIECPCLEDGAAWALRRAQKHNNVEVPVGEKCEQCYQLHQRCFSHMTWSQFCAGDSAQKASISEARKSMFEKASKEHNASHILQERAQVLEISKKYQVLTEKEVKKLAGLSNRSPRR